MAQLGVNPVSSKDMFARPPRWGGQTRRCDTGSLRDFQWRRQFPHSYYARGLKGCQYRFLFLKLAAIAYHWRLVVGTVSSMS